MLKAACLILIIACLAITSGCRAIRRTVSNSESIEARRLSREGLAAIHEQRWQDAQDLFEVALSLCKTDERAHGGYGEVLWHRGLQSEAIKHLEQAVELSGGSPELRIRLGTMYLEQGLVDAAAIQASEVLAVERDSPAGWALSGRVLMQKNQLDAALASFHRALAINANDPEVVIAIANVYDRQKRHDRLLATVQGLDKRRLDTNAQATVAYLQGCAYRGLGNNTTATSLFREALALRPGDSDIVASLAQLEQIRRNDTTPDAMLAEEPTISDGADETIRVADSLPSERSASVQQTEGRESSLR